MLPARLTDFQFTPVSHALTAEELGWGWGWGWQWQHYQTLSAKKNKGAKCGL